ncbi:hypothetical protein PSENEW3n2_00000832 [Picochlorum sp. SENEW3]|nr:hypothetical protein PSENEW3n2_00000832 [Picochlorum sp. SENEW3]WPT15754.1 hypothetical protein PSENEW3_00000832 [Picochlorum sp. SENEW3]
MARRKKNTLWLRSRIQHPIRYCQVVAAEEKKLRRILRDNPNYSDSTRVRSRVRRARWSVTREYPGLAPFVSEPQETEDRGQDSEEEYESDDSYDGIVSRRDLESERSVHEERNKREEEAWGKVRNKIVDQAKLRHRDRWHSLQIAMHTEKERIKSKVESVSKTCPRCRGSGSLLSEFDRRKVTILTMQFCHVISIPLIECARCNMHGPSGCGRFHVIPADIDAFPSTPDWPFDLFHALRDDKVVLYHMDLLTFLRDQIDFSPRLAVSSFAKGFKRTLMRNGCHVKISAEQMSKHLSRALHEYTIFEMTANDPYMYSSTHRDCPMECPACLGSQNHLIHISKTKVEKAGADMATFEPITSGSQVLLHSVYIDGHYGLPHMAKAGKSRQYDPPFSIKLLPDNEVQEFEEHYTSQSRATAVATCGSEFQADSFLKRRSQYHDRTGVVGAFCRHGSCLLMHDKRYAEVPLVQMWRHSMKTDSNVLQIQGTCGVMGDSKATRAWHNGVLMDHPGDGIPIAPHALPDARHSLSIEEQLPERRICRCWSGGAHGNCLVPLQESRACTTVSVPVWQSCGHREIGAQLESHQAPRVHKKLLWDASQRAEAKIQLAEREVQELIGLLQASGLSQDEVIQMRDNPPAGVDRYRPEQSFEVQFAEARLRLRCEQNRVTALFHQKEILRLQENRMLTRRGEAARLRKRKKALESQLRKVVRQVIDISSLIYSIHCENCLEPRQGGPIASIVFPDFASYMRAVSPPETRQAWEEAEVIYRLVGPFQDGEPLNAQRFHAALEEGRYPWISNSSTMVESYRVQLHAKANLLSRAREEKQLLLEEIKGCELLLHSEKAAVDAEIAGIQGRIEEHQLHQDARIPEENSPYAYTLGVELQEQHSQVESLYFHKLQLEKVKAEVSTLATKARLCADVFVRGARPDHSQILDDTPAQDDDPFDNEINNEENEVVAE